MIKINFILSKSKKRTIYVASGLSILEIAHNNGIYEIHGTCEGLLSCQTCHIIIEEKFYKIVNQYNPINNEEQDALYATLTNDRYMRFGCQVYTHFSMNNIKIIIPNINTF